MEKQWWDDAPLADDGNWWESAPIASDPTKESQESGIKRAALTVASGVDRGLVGLTGGIGQFLQAPAANTLAAIKGGDALLTKGENWLRSKTGMQPLKATEEINKDAQMASAFAAERRKANVNADGGTWANPATAVARLGKGLQEDARTRLAQAAEYDKANYPEFVQQQQNLSNAEGFTGNLKAIKDNPLAFTHTAAKSLPDMLAGVGAARIASAGKLVTAKAAGAEAAAKAAASGLGPVAQARVAQRAVDAVQKEAMAKASTAGMLAEGTSSSYQSREGVYQTVASMPLEKLSQSPRFQELSASTGNQEQAREILANELADQVSLLSAAGTVTGTVLNNRLFGGDATAKAVAGVGRVSAKETGKRIAAEGTEEVIQGAPEDLVNFAAVSQADSTAKWDPAGAAAQNLAAGLAMGGGGHGSRYAAGRMASFTPPNSPTAQAGLPEIVVPIVPTKEPANVSLRDAPVAVAGEGGQQASGQPSTSVGDLRLGADDGGGRGGNSARSMEPVDAALVPIRDASGQPIAFVEGDPLVRSRDSDLLSRAEAQAPQTEQPQQTAPVTIWTGRAGDGYADIEAAQAGLQTRIKREPELRWEVEQMPSGKYRLAGYEQVNQSAIPTSSDAAQQPAQTIQTEIKQDSFDTSAQPVQNSPDFVQVQQGAGRVIEPTNSLSRTASWVIRDRQSGEVLFETFDQKKVGALNTEKYEAVPIGEYLGSLNKKPSSVVEKPLDMRLIPMSKRAQYADAIAGGGAPAQAPLMADKPDGTLAVTGDPKALKQQLINAGIPSQSIMKSKTGVLIGRSQVAKVREFFAPQSMRSSIDGTSAQRDTADYAPATQAHRDAAAKFARAIGGRIEGRPANDLLDAVAPGGGDRGRAARTVSSVARRIFSREVVYVKFKGDQKFNGAVSKASPGYIFINIDSQKPLMAVLGHELLHELEKNQPGIYADLSRSLGALLKNETAYTNRLLANYKKQGISTKDLRAREELEADIVGDNFMDPEFWQALSQEQPSLFRRIADAIIKWLDGVAGKIGTERPFGTDQFLTDIAAAREAVASAMRQFSGAEVGAVTDGAAGDDTRLAIAYHGSPHRFDKFTLDKIGTGEGAQAYGYGLYFASKKEVADHYRSVLTGKFYAGTDEAGDWFVYSGNDKKESGPYISSAEANEAAKAAQRKAGQLYEVEIPEDTEMLWWDKPLSEQPEKVREALLDSGDPYVKAVLSSSPVSKDDGEYWSFMGETYNSKREALLDHAGEDIVRGKRANFGESPQQVSRELRSLGIRGIKYLDASSRLAGGGSYNYVIFDDADVQIEKTYFSIADQRGKTDAMPETTAPGPQGDERSGAKQGNAVTSKWFTEENRLSNLPKTGASWQRIRENNPALRGKSVDDTITVYRATIGDSIRPDDYVAVDKSTLRAELENVRERDGSAAKIVSKQVQVRDLLMGNDATEFVFFPENGSATSNESTTPTSDGVTRFSRQQDTIEVDGIQRPRTNSNGQPIHPTEDGIRNFWRWFGDSKVVDAEGRPLVVYHGTSGNFNEFADRYENDVGGKNFGRKDYWHYFSTSPESASAYAVNADRNQRYSPIDPNASRANVMPAYVAIENPLFVSPDSNATWTDSGVEFADLTRKAQKEKYLDGSFDGLIISDRDGTVSAVATEFPGSIKSATGNQGTFGPSSADIRFSVQAPQGQRFTLPEDGATAITRIKLQDDALRMKRVIDAVKEQGGTVGERQNFYDANTLMPGRVQSMMDDFRNDAVLPMLKKAAAADISMDELSLYAYARHAEERNAYIATINPKMQDGGSGMTNADAQAILAEFEKSGKAAEYADLHADLMGITAATRRTMLDEGLITQEQHDAMDGQYDNYIPLRGFENVEPETGAVRPGVGRGINVRGKETIRALGRRSRAGDLIENVIRDYQRAVVKSEKNNVGKVFLDFVLSNPDPDLWGVDVEKGKATLNKATGQVEYSSTIDKGEDTVGVKVAGQQVYIQIKDKALARAMRHAWKDETGDLERAAVAVSGWYNNLLRNVLTRYNPPFAIVNTIRDAQSGAVAALDELGAKGAKRFAFYYPKAVAASYRGERGWGTGTIFQNPVMDKYFTEFKNSGAITGGFFMKDLSDIASDMKTDMLQAGAAPKNLSERARASIPWLVGSKVLGALEFMGTVSENTTRFALYMAARDSGRTPSEAALLAKNGTTNFNRKGEWGGTLNALYLFFNAAVQGNAQLFKTLKNPKVRAAMATVAGVGVAAAIFGAAGGGEDDDGQAYWDKIPDYEKERNLIIMLPPGDSLGKGVERVGQYGRYIKIPVQYGLNFFPNIGYMMADVYRNQQDPTSGKTIGQATRHLMSVTFGSVNPFGGSVDVTDSVSLAMALAPTLLDLPIMLGTERNSFGSPVAPSKFPGDTKPDSERMFASDIDTVPANIAKALNDWGGGNEAKPGKILGVETSITPGTIENLIRASTGGLGIFGVQLWDVGAQLASDGGLRGKGAESSNWPVLNKVYGEVGPSQNIRLAGERMREVRAVSKVIKDQIKMGIEPEVSEADDRLQELAKAQEQYDDQMRKLRKEEIAILKDKELTNEKKRLELDNIRALQDELSSVINRVYLEQLGPVKKGELEVSVTP